MSSLQVDAAAAAVAALWAGPEIKEVSMLMFSVRDS